MILSSSLSDLSILLEAEGAPRRRTKQKRLESVFIHIRRVTHAHTSIHTVRLSSLVFGDPDFSILGAKPFSLIWAKPFNSLFGISHANMRHARTLPLENAKTRRRKLPAIPTIGGCARRAVHFKTMPTVHRFTVCKRSHGIFTLSRLLELTVLQVVLHPPDVLGRSVFLYPATNSCSLMWSFIHLWHLHAIAWSFFFMV